MEKIQVESKSNDGKKTVNKFDSSCLSSLRMEKIRSGQAFLYREGGFESMVVDVRMKDDICGDSLKKALSTALLRYPYLTDKIIEKDGDFYLVPNSLPFILEETAKLHSLGSAEIHYHLIDVTYKGKAIFIAYHHGLCDGCGIMPFIKTLVYYYCTYKYNHKLNVPDVRLAGELLLINETAEPLKDGSINTDETELPKIYKDGFSLPDSINSVGKNKYYRYEVKIKHESFMKFVKENNATPSIVVALFVSKAIKSIYPETEKPILCNLASNMRKGINLDNTFKNCVISMCLPYMDGFEKLSIKEQATTYREIIEEHKRPDSIKRNIKSILSLCDKLDKLPSYEAKKKMLSFFNDLITNTFILSYVGQIKLGDCEQYIDSFHTYTSGTTGLTMQMLSVGEYITINFMQSFETNKYINAFAYEMEKVGLKFFISDIIEFTTPKDAISSGFFAPEQITPLMDHEPAHLNNQRVCPLPKAT